MDHSANNFSAQWTPDPHDLLNLVTMLHEATSQSNEVQLQIYNHLQQFSARPDFNMYLAYILCKVTTISREQPTVPHLQSNQPTLLVEKDPYPPIDITIRQTAGLLLKNNLKTSAGLLSHDNIYFLYSKLLKALGDDSKQIRSTVAHCITVIVSIVDLKDWPQLLPALVHYIDLGPDAYYIQGALDAIAKICEDSAQKLCEDSSGSLDLILPKVMNCFQSPIDSVRVDAIHSINQFLYLMPPILADNIILVVAKILAIANDPCSAVRKHVCAAVCMIVETVPEALDNEMNNIIQYMLHSSRDPNEEVALEACEFWSAIAEKENAFVLLQDFLPRILDMLLTNMIYSELDQAVFGNDDEEDNFVPDRPQDINPQSYHYSSRKTASLNGNGFAFTPSQELNGTNPNVHHNHSHREKYKDDEDDDRDGQDDDDDDDNDDDDDGSEWNIRKCSAAGLDSLAISLQEHLLPPLLPLFEQKLNDDVHWEVREATILAIGAIAEGCYDVMVPYLPSIIPLLIKLIQDKHYLVRGISCWSLSRYSNWIAENHAQDGIMPLVIRLLLERILDQNKRVQKHACSAFACMEESLGSLLVPYLDQIVHTLAIASERYQQKNLIALYDTIGTLANCVGFELGQQKFIDILIPALVKKWNALGDLDPLLLTLIYCLTNIFHALGDKADLFLEPVFFRCLKIMELTLSKVSSGHYLDVDLQFITGCLDLISSCAEVSDSVFQKLYPDTKLLELLFVIMKDGREDMKQSSFGLLGELCKCPCPLFLQALTDYINLLVQNINPNHVGICNNAVWATGEIAIMIYNQQDNTEYKVVLSNFVGDILAKLTGIITMTNLDKNLADNTALTIGKLGLVLPNLVAPTLVLFSRRCCITLRNMRDDIEKEQAFRGLCETVKVNPNGIIENFIYFCDAINSWYRCGPDLFQQFSQILHGFKESMGSEWLGYYSAFPPALRLALTEKYGL